MADEYRFFGKSGLFFEKLYSSQYVRVLLERAMARVSPCLFYFEGKCKLKADEYSSDEEAENPGEDLKTPCVGAKVRCRYYTGVFKYLNKEYVKDGRYILAQHIVELFSAYLKHQCTYDAVNVLAYEKGVSSYWGIDEDPLRTVVVLPRRVYIKDNEIVSLPYHPPSVEYKDYVDFVTDDFFEFFLPRAIYPLNVNEIIYQGNYISVLLDVPGNGDTYVICISELNLSENTFTLINDFFKTGVFNEGNQNLSVVFEEIFHKLSDKQNSDLLIKCDKIGFGVSLATLCSRFDLSKCLIVYSDSNIVFNNSMFVLSKVSVGMFDANKAVCVNLEMFYNDISFASNCIYDLATNYTLDVSYKNVNIDECPKIHADYKGQDLSFGARVFSLNAGLTEEVTMTSLPLQWYYFNEETRKYLWTLEKKEKKYKIDINVNKTKTEFEDGDVIFFKNVIILKIKNQVYPFYIKDCTYNSYKYKTKYQAYHPMFEYYDINSDFSFSVKKAENVLIEEDISDERQPNPNRSQPQSEEVLEEETIILLRSLPAGVVILIPDVEEYNSDFADEVKLEFTLVIGNKVEYFTKTEGCKKENLFIPEECDNVESFDMKDLSKDKGVCEDPIKVEQKCSEEDDGDTETNISLSNLIKNPFNSPYYIKVTCDLEVDEGTGATYKQEDIKSVFYFYFSYLSFKFLFEDVIKKQEEEQRDYENSNIQKLIRGEKPLTAVEDLNECQEKREGAHGALGQKEYNFKYLYEKTVRSYINNKFYEPFSISFLEGKENNPWARLFSNSISDFYIALELKKKKEQEEQEEKYVEIKHNLTHISEVCRFFGLPICGFNKDKLELDNKYPENEEESIFDKIVFDNFNCKFNEFFYFYILGVSKFVQDYLFFIKYKENIIPILKRIPVVVSQVGLPDPEVMYKWKSKYDVYTYSYNTGLNPFEKVIDSNNLDFFINPFYVIIHEKYRDTKYRNRGTNQDNRTASIDYGFLFTSNWWIKYKKTMDNYGFIGLQSMVKARNLFLDVYRTLAHSQLSEISEEDIIKGFAQGKSILYIELDSIDYIYCSYCGDHDFVLGNTTPYLYDRASDFPLAGEIEDPVVEGRSFDGVYYTGDYDKYGIGMRRARPCSRFVGPMWFPFRACEVSRYNEFADYPGVKHFKDGQNNIYRRYIRGFSCTDLIFKPYSGDDFEFSDFKYLFIDDYFGSINPYRYSSSFYSIDVLNYYKSASSTTTFEVAPTYLPSNASVPWRSIPIIFKDGENDSIVIVKPREYIIGPVTSGTLENSEGIDECVVLDVSSYRDFDILDTGFVVNRSVEPKPGEIRSILYNCLIDIPPMLPYNYDRNKYICGYERMRAGDANFIYQCLYPYHHNYTYLPGCKCVFDYKNKGKDAYGPIEGTLLPSVLPITTDAEMIVSNSVFFPSLICKRPAYMPCRCELILFAQDYLSKETPYVSLGCRTTGPYSLIAEPYVIPWVEGNYSFWEHYDKLECETDGPELMKLCLNEYTKTKPGATHFIGAIIIDKNSDCCSSSFISDDEHNAINLKTAPLYYHFASAWRQAYDYVFLGASIKSKPIFYGDGALRMFETYDDLKKSYFIFDKEKEVNNVGVLPVFGGLGKFFRLCYFSSNYGRVPFSTLSGVNPNDDNYVYKLSGYSDNDAVFNNNFEYGYLPEKDPVFVTDDFGLFGSIISFTDDDSITFETHDCVCFNDLIEYIEPEREGEKGYYKYKGGDIEISNFGNEEPVISGPALIVIYDTRVSASDKYNYYSDVGLSVSIAEPVVGDMGAVVDPFPFGEKVKIEYLPCTYSNGYLYGDSIRLKLTGVGVCSITHPCYIDIKVKERPSNISGPPWMFYVELEESVVNNDGEVETKIVELQKVYLKYFDCYSVGTLVQKDDTDEMSLNDYDVIQKGNIKYKINRGFYLEFDNMFLSHETCNIYCRLQGFHSSNFSVTMGSSNESSSCCYGVAKDASKSVYIEVDFDCFIIDFTFGVFLSGKYSCSTTVGHVCLETSEEFYGIGNLVADPEYDTSGENKEDGGKYRYMLRFEAYDNYNKIMYCGTKYRFVFNDVVFFCDVYNDMQVKVKCGRFTGGKLCEVTFNKVSSLKAITYSRNIDNIISGQVKGINLYKENLNDKIKVGDSVFYAMPFGFVYKLSGGISSDRDVEFKEGYGGEFSEQCENIEYNDKEQALLDKIVLPVEKDIFKLIHYSTSFIRFCLKSEVFNTRTEEYVIFNAGLVPDLYKAFGYVPISQWVAPGHKLDLYPDSFYSTYHFAACNSTYLVKAFCSGCLDMYSDNLNILAEVPSEKEKTCLELLNWCNVSFNTSAVGNYFVIPYNILFVTHVEHGMFGYPDVVDVSTWIEQPTKPTAYFFYDENGEPIGEE